MARKKYWIGSTGPFYYDDDKSVNDPEGIETSKQSGIVAPRVKVKEAPVDPDDALRKDDVAGGYANHASNHEVGGTDLIDHDSLAGYVADEHVSHASGLTTTWTVTAGDVVTITKGLITAIN